MYHDAFAKSLKFDRARFALTKQDVADKVSISLEAYEDIESGVNLNPPMSVIHGLADLFGIDRGIMEVGFEEALRLKLEQGVSN